jgi:hypothetical protein
MAKYAILTLLGILLLCTTLNAQPVHVSLTDGGASEIPWGPVIQYPALENAEECKGYKENNRCLEQLCYQYTTVLRDSEKLNIAPEELFHWYNQKYAECFQADQAL